MSATNEESQGASAPPTAEEAQPSAMAGAGGPPTEPGRRSIGELLRGDLGFIPVLVTLIIIALIFQFLTEGVFLQARNLSNLSIQIVTVGTIAIAAVFIL